MSYQPRSGDTLFAFTAERIPPYFFVKAAILTRAGLLSGRIQRRFECQQRRVQGTKPTGKNKILYKNETQRQFVCVKNGLL